MQEFNKKYNPESIQNEISELWLGEPFNAKIKTSNTITGLPLPTATPLHLGHAVNAITADVIKRYNHMKDKEFNLNPLWYYGSFLTNEKINEQLNKIGTSKNKISKGSFWDVMWNQIKKQKNYNTNQLAKLGVSTDFSKEKSSFNVGFARKLRKLFYNLIQDDTIFEAEDIVYRDTKYQTSVGKDEVLREERKGKKYTIKYFISTKNNCLDVITSAPETIFGDVALAVNPNNKKYHNLVGQRAIIPIVNKTIPIIADDRVDMFANNGVMRITPAHDLVSLKIAKEHNLPIDKFAINQDGKFTELAGAYFGGKNVAEFTKNIIQNLDDIDNLVEEEDCLVKVPVCKKTGEIPQTMCLIQWFLNIEKAKENLSQSIETGEFKVFSNKYVEVLKQHLSEINNRCISKKYARGQNLPIWISEDKNLIYVLDEEDVISAYKKKKSKSKVLLSLIIFNLIADGLLNNTFEMEDLVNILLSDNLENGGKILDVYISILDKDLGLYKPQISELKEIAQYATKGKTDNIEKFAAAFLKILDNSFLLEQVGADKYLFDMDSLVRGDSGLRQEKSKFDISFVNSVLVMDSLGLLDSTAKKLKAKEDIIVTVGENVLLDIDRVCMLSYIINNKLPFDTVLVNKMIQDNKGRKMGALSKDNVDPNSIIREHGADVIRLYLLAEGDDVLLNNNKRLDYYTDFMNKRWNASRYVSAKAQYIYGKKKINLNTLEKEIEKNLNSLKDFDLWILNKLKSINEDIELYISANNITEYTSKLINFIKKDFCEKYLEISKNSKSEFTDKVMIYVVANTLKLLSPFAPFASEKIWILMGLQDFVGESKLKSEILPDITKNYKIQLFMDIVDKFGEIKEELNTAKHNMVDIFIKANPDFLRFTKSNENVIKKIINISSIEYLDINEEDIHGHTTCEIIDMRIGLKALNEELEVEIERPKSLKDLQLELKKKKEYIQVLKNITSSMIENNKDESEIKKQKKEINKIKDDILDIEYQIGKMKLD